MKAISLIRAHPKSGLLVELEYPELLNAARVAYLLNPDEYLRMKVRLA